MTSLYRRLLLLLLHRSIRHSSTTTTTTYASSTATTSTKDAAHIFLETPRYCCGDWRERAIYRRRLNPRGVYIRPPAIQKIHDHVVSLIDGGNFEAASAIACEHAISFKIARFSLGTCDLLMEAMYQAGRYEDIVALYHYLYKHMKTKGHLSFHTSCYHRLIDAHFATGNADQALYVYHHMEMDAGFIINSKTFYHLTKGLVSADRISDAMNLLREMKDPDPFVYNNLIYGFLELNNDIESANELLNKLIARDTPRDNDDAVVYSTYMEYYFKRGMEKEAMEKYQSLLDRKISLSPETCNAVLEVLVRYNKSIEAKTLFYNMLNSHTGREEGLNSKTFNIMVNECLRLGKVSEALSVFNYRKGKDENAILFVMDAVGYNNIIGKLCEIGMVEEANAVFQEALNNKQPRPGPHDFFMKLYNPNFEDDRNYTYGMADVTTFKILFDAYFREGRIDDVLKLFKFLLFETSLKPSETLVNSVLSKVINKVTGEEAEEILKRMPERCQEPYPTSYELVLTELCKRGHFDHVHDVLAFMERNNIEVSPELHSTVNEYFY